MALLLQGEKDYKWRVESALKAVELEGYEKIKPNRLSGGQKQRVAIARAIVKNPQLLLCDAPTGALDSETGATIFELLKQISKNTLVVVVSHDRESAEKYGDSIIELKSGKIISDSGEKKSTALQSKCNCPRNIGRRNADSGKKTGRNAF